MKTLFVMMMFVGAILLAGCTQADGSVKTPTTAAIAQRRTTAEEPTAVLPTNTPQPEPTITTASPTYTAQPEPTETAVAPASTPPLEQTETAVAAQPTAAEAQATATSTAAPLSESTTTPLPEPTATAISCDGILTSSNQEGPFYSPGSPERTSLIDDGIPGVPILIIGRVFDQDCSPMAGAKLDFWLADVDGEYDNLGYTLRGHVFTDENGNYALESIEPTSYTGRPPHIHVKVFAPDGQEMLTTQMYFSGSEDSSDVNTSPDLLADYLEPDHAGRQQALFNFVVQYR